MSFHPRARGIHGALKRMRRRATHVHVYRLTPAGRKVTLIELRAPAMFGSMALLGQGMDSDFAEAVQDSLICTVSRHTLERLPHRRPDVALRLLTAIARRL